MLTGVEIYIRPCITSRVTIIYGAQQQKYAEKDYNKFENVKTSASYTFLLANNQKQTLNRITTHLQLSGKSSWWSSSEISTTLVPFVLNPRNDYFFLNLATIIDVYWKMVFQLIQFLESVENKDMKHHVPSSSIFNAQKVPKIIFIISNTIKIYL